jgi:TonB family protein
MQTNSCAFGTWIVLATLLAPGAARSADDPPASAQAQPPAQVERLVPVFRLAPEYPRSAARDGISGFVEFLVIVNPDGTVRELRVTQSEPPGVFDAAAGNALMRWKFKPKLVDGKPVEASGTQQITFELDSAQKTSKETACEKSRKPARRDRTVSRDTTARLEAALKLVGASDLPGAESALVELTESARNDYERAVVLQALGYVYVKQQKDDKAISSYEQALATNTLSWATHDQITFALAKLYLISGKQEQGMQLLDAHLREACRPSPDARALKQKLAPPPPSP